jgi:hypothetical protein
VDLGKSLPTDPTAASLGHFLPFAALADNLSVPKFMNPVLIPKGPGIIFFIQPATATNYGGHPIRCRQSLPVSKIA